MLPVWTAYGHRGDLERFPQRAEGGRQAELVLADLDTAALPRFEHLDELVASNDHFLEGMA